MAATASLHKILFRHFVLRRGKFIFRSNKPNIQVKRSFCGSCSFHQQQNSSATDDSEPETPVSSNNIRRAEDIKLTILHASLQFVPKHGWSNAAIAEGGRSAGYSRMSQAMFDSGEVQLINYHHNLCREQLDNHMKQYLEEQPHQSVSSLISTAVKQRLEMNGPYIDHLPQCLAIMALPQNALDCWQNVLKLSDDVWHHTGDMSTDWTWYSKRLSLSAVYKICEVHMAQDASEGFEDTWQLLQRLIHALDDASAYSHPFQQVSFANSVSTIATTGLNILGLNRWRFKY